MNDSFTARLVVVAIATLPLAMPVAAAAATALPGLPKMHELRPQQDAAEAAFSDGDYEKAMTVFKDTLAPAGDKYAQYMVGHMLLNGLGADADPVLGAAWFALAAERGDTAYQSVHNEVLGQLDADTRRLSSELASDLLATYGDCALVKGAMDERQAQLDDPAALAALSDDEPPPRFGPSTYTERGPAKPRELKRDIRKMQDYLDSNCR